MVILECLSIRISLSNVYKQLNINKSLYLSFRKDDHMEHDIKIKYMLLLKIVLFSFLVLSAAQRSNAQGITSADTVCPGVPVTFSLNSDNNFISYAWEFETQSLSQIISNALPIPNTGTNGNSFAVVAQATMVYDTSNNSYYAFVTNTSSGYTNPSVQRLSFGANPNSTPSNVNLGNPNNAFIATSYSNLEAVELVLDENGIFHAFFTNRGIVHWIFGNGLNNPPTQAERIFDNTNVMGMGMQLSILRENNQWTIFAGQAYGPANIIRLDLGPDLNNIPNIVPSTMLPRPLSGYFNHPSYFAMLKDMGSWYMYVTTLGGSTPLVKYSFGTNLQNNNPTVSSLGTTNPPLIDNRGLNFVKGCDTFFMLGLNQDGTILSFNFQNSLNNIPSVQSLGTRYGSNVNMQVLKPYWYNDTLWALSGSWNSHPTSNIFRLPILCIPSGNSIIKYHNPTATYTFSTPGIYNVTLYCDQADPRGPQAFCKQIVVAKNKPILGPDTIVCNMKSYTIDASTANASGYVWNTGDTTSSITINETGTFWVTLTDSECASSDTIHVTFAPSPQIIVSPDTMICKGDTLSLNASGAESFTWTPSTFLNNPNVANPISNPLSTIRYYVTGTNSFGCVTVDSILITLAPAMDLKIVTEGDTVSCNMTSVQLHASGAQSYVWSPSEYFNDPSNPDPIVSPTRYTTFYLIGKDKFGCTDTTSINIMVVKEPLFFVPTAFSPNGDGHNDIFKPIIYCDFTISRFSIFNRWGQLIYTSNNQHIGWDGFFNKLQADVGTYFWYIEGQNEKREKIQRRGDVLLLR